MQDDRSHFARVQSLSMRTLVDRPRQGPCRGWRADVASISTALARESVAMVFSLALLLVCVRLAFWCDCLTLLLLPWVGAVIRTGFLIAP